MQKLIMWPFLYFYSRKWFRLNNILLIIFLIKYSMSAIYQSWALALFFAQNIDGIVNCNEQKLIRTLSAPSNLTPNSKLRLKIKD